MKVITLSLLLLHSISFTLKAEEKEVVLHLCKSCTYSEAKYFAKKETPSMRCEAATPGQIMTIENQACYADEKKVIIADTLSDNHFTFVVGYYNQGLPAFNLEKYVNNTTPSNIDLSAINKIKITDKNFSAFLKEAQETIKQRAIDHSFNTAYNFTATSTSNRNETCPAVIKQAVSAAFGGRTASAIQSKLNDKAYRDFKNPESFFLTDEMDSIGFSISTSGFSYQGSWKKISRNFNVPVNLNTSPDSDAPSSDTNYKVVFNIKWIKEYGALSVGLNPLLTKFEGSSLEQLKRGGAKNISSCLEAALDQHLPHSPKIPTGNPGGGGSSGGSGSIGGGDSGTPIFGGGSGGTSGGSSTCEKHYYDIEGTKITTIQVRC